MWKKDFKHISSKIQETKKVSNNKSFIPTVKTSSNASKPQKNVQKKSGHKRNYTKGSLSKFVNKKKNFLKDTAGSKSRKNFGREKAQRIRKISKEKTLLDSQNKLRSAKDPLPQEDLNDLIQLADMFWENLGLEDKVQSPPTKIKQTKIIKKWKPVMDEKKRKNQQEKQKIQHKESKISENKYFQKKFEEKLVKINRNERSVQRKKIQKQTIGNFF